jgi:glycogen(starch) synthase
VRIVLVSREYPPADFMGGIGTYTATIARALVRRGHDVSVVSRGDGAEYVDEGVHVIRLDHRWLPHPIAERLLANRGIAARARRIRPDVVQAAEWEAEAWWLARFGAIPVVTRLATPTYMLDRLNYGGERPETWFVRRLEREQTLHSAAVLAPTRAIAERVSVDWQLGDGSLDVIPNPVDVEEVTRLAAAAEPPDVPERMLVFFGRMERRKGIEVLARALPRVLRRDSELHAVFIGRDPGDEEGALMQRFWRTVEPVRDRVHVLGELRREQALAALARAEIVVLPSLWESFGYVCVEAMALGRAVVASRAGGLAEIVEDDSNGWLSPAGDSDMLADVLERRLGDAAALRRVGDAAARRAADFAPPRIAERVEELYERAIERRGRIAPGVYRRDYRRHFRPDEPQGPFTELYARKREAVLAGFRGRERLRIVDVGGGYGRLAGPLAESHDVTLCDISPQMLDEARARWSGLQLVEADARQLPFSNGEFDAAIAIDLIPHLRELEPGVRELARVIRPGGQLVFDTSNAFPWWVLAYPSYTGWRPGRLVRTLLAGGVPPEWQALVRHHRAREARKAIAAAGLRVERLQRFGPWWTPKWHLWWTRKP